MGPIDHDNTAPGGEHPPTLLEQLAKDILGSAAAIAPQEYVGVGPDRLCRIRVPIGKKCRNDSRSGRQSRPRYCLHKRRE